MLKLDTELPWCVRWCFPQLVRLEYIEVTSTIVIEGNPWVQGANPRRRWKSRESLVSKMHQSLTPYQGATTLMAASSTTSHLHNVRYPHIYIYRLLDLYLKSVRTVGWFHPFPASLHIRPCRAAHRFAAATLVTGALPPSSQRLRFIRSTISMKWRVEGLVGWQCSPASQAKRRLAKGFMLGHLPTSSFFLDQGVKHDAGSLHHGISLRC